MKLPTKKTKQLKVDPKSMVIYSHPKVGKTTALSGLDDCLTIDLERGSDFVEILKFDLMEEVDKENAQRTKDGKGIIPPIAVLMKLIQTLKQVKLETGEYAYRYIALDTLSALEEISLDLAARLYRSTPMGRNWVGDNVLDLPKGAGYLYLREAMKQIIAELKECCECLIMMGHVRDKLIEIQGEEIEERGLKLAGILPAIICSDVDAVGYMYREENQTVINFKASKTTTSESRAKHISNRIIPVIIHNEETDELTVDWSEIFIEKY